MNNKKQLDGLGKAGAILNIVSASFLLLYGIIFSIMFIIFLFIEQDPFMIIPLIIGIVFMILAPFSLVFNIRVLKGRIDQKIFAVIFGFIASSWLGSILLLVSKEQQPRYKSTVVEEIKHYKSLLDEGAITEEEYTGLKRKCLQEKLEE